MSAPDFNELIGKTLISAEIFENEELVFITDSGEKYVLHEHNDECDDDEPSMLDVCGDLKDLVGSPILLADETGHGGFEYDYHKFATIKGYVDICWRGANDGYYTYGAWFCKGDCKEGLKRLLEKYEKTCFKKYTIVLNMLNENLKCDERI